MRWAVLGCALAGASLTWAASPAHEKPLRAWAFVALAGIVGILATRTWGRRVVGAALVLSGLGAAATAIGGTGAAASVGAGGGVVLAATGVVTGVRGPRWRVLGARYDAPIAESRKELDFWGALDRGEDPTE